MTAFIETPNKSHQGSARGSVAPASAWCAARRSCVGAARYTADRTSGCRNVTRSPIASNPASAAGATAPAPIPSRSAARHTRAGSPAGSAGYQDGYQPAGYDYQRLRMRTQARQT
jgi:hypothetical protein